MTNLGYIVNHSQLTALYCENTSSMALQAVFVLQYECTMLSFTQSTNRKTTRKKQIDHVRVREPLGKSDHSQIQFNLRVKTINKGTKQKGETMMNIIIIMSKIKN